MNYRKNWMAAWNAYKMKCETSFLTRNGTIACGLTKAINFEEIYQGSRPAEAVDFEAIYQKPEFVAEHEGRTAFLYGLIKRWGYDEYCNDPRYRHFFFSDQYDLETMMFLLAHDVGEIAAGDALDDGSNSHNESREAEDEVLDKFYGYFPSRDRDLFASWHKDFEDYSGSDRVKFLKAIDKVEAITFQLFLYTKGLCGDVMRKDPPSQRDLRFANIICTTRAIDVWTLHYRVATKHIDPVLLQPIAEFLETAFFEVYDYLPNCMTIDVTDIELDE